MRQDADWVPETRFGTWFLGTRIWLRYVLAEAIDVFSTLLGDSRRFPIILDVGCGGGQAFPLLEARFDPEQLLAVDVDANLVTLAAQAARRCACDVAVRVGNATALDLPEHAVDMVFCHQMLHHLFEPEHAMSEFHRVLKPGGVLLLAESCRPFLRSLPVRTLFRHPPVSRQKSADEYLDLVRARGFEFGLESVSLPSPMWSRPDFGLREWLGRPTRLGTEPPLVQVAARRASSHSTP